MSGIEPIPEGGLLLHIGPQKTGSTSIQESLHNAREELVQHGVLYPGDRRRPVEAGWAVLGEGAPLGRRPPRIAMWERLVRQLHETSLPRRILSNEDLARASDEVVERILTDLGADDVHLVYVARRYDQLLPSHWQERLKARQTMSFEYFLRLVLEGKHSTWEWKLMWQCQLPDLILASWGRFVPPERTTVIVLEGDHDLLPRSFEQLLALPAGLLESPDQVQNRSYTFQEAEALRRINQVCADHGWSNHRYLNLVRRGIARHWTNSARPVGADKIPGLPAWALEHVDVLADRQADAIAASGCRVIGSPDSLRTRGRVTAYDGPTELDQVPLDVLVQAVDQLVERVDTVELKTQERLQAAEEAGLTTAGGRALVREVARRFRRRLRPSR